MKALVFAGPQMDAEPYTTSEVIAECAEVGHRKIKSAIRKYENELEGFGVLAPYQAETPDNRTGGRKATGYRLNEAQATFLMTLLKNTPNVVAFKKELVRQFYVMRSELQKRQVQHARLNPARRDMTNAIRDFLPDSPHKAMWYKHYTDLAYRAAFGKSAAEIRRERGVPRNAPAASCLTAEELEAVERLTRQIGVLLEMRMDYQEIKAMVTGIGRGVEG